MEYQWKIKLVILCKKSSFILRSSTIGILGNSYLKLIQATTTWHPFFRWNKLWRKGDIPAQSLFSFYALQKEAHDKIESNDVLHYKSEVQKEGYPDTKEFSACALYFL